MISNFFKKFIVLVMIFMTSGFVMADDITNEPGVTVPVPGDLDQMGSLEIDGTPGVGQDSNVKVIFCQTDVDGKLQKFGCNDTGNADTYQINKVVNLPVGTYELIYSNSIIFTEVKAGQKTIVQLKKIQVASSKSGASISFQVFIDLTDPSMQELILKNVFLNPENNEYFEQQCKSSGDCSKKACNAFNSNDYHNLLNTVVKFDDDGSHEFLYYPYTDATDGHFHNQGLIKIADPIAGQFISVFTGVYGIIFTDSTSGKTETQFGVKVN